MNKKVNIKNAINVISGNFFEMYDFIIFGYYADYIAKNFFPLKSEFASLSLAFITFGAGYLMRPIGALILGPYIDQLGRKKGLLITLILMGISTLLIACLPSYNQIGIVAPILVVFSRLLQGLSAGAELGGVSIYLYEIAPKNKKGFYVSWQSASQQLAVIFSAVVGLTLNYFFNSKSMYDFGWRIPLFIGLMIIPYLFILRNKLEETEVFKNKNKKRIITIKEIFYLIKKNWKIILIGMLIATTTCCFFYMITVFTTIYSKTVLIFNSKETFFIILLVGISNFFWLPIIASISDKIGKRPILIIFSLLMCLTFYPALLFLTKHQSTMNFVITELWFSFMYAGYNSAAIVTLTKIMPMQIKATGFSIAYSIAAIIGGYTPTINNLLIHFTGNKASPGIWITLVSLLSLITISFILPKYLKE